LARHAVHRALRVHLERRDTALLPLRQEMQDNLGCRDALPVSVHASPNRHLSRTKAHSSVHYRPRQGCSAGRDAIAELLQHVFDPLPPGADIRGLGGLVEVTLEVRCVDYPHSTPANLEVCSVAPSHLRWFRYTSGAG